MSVSFESYIEVKNPESGKWEPRDSPDDRDIFSYEALQFLGDCHNKQHFCPVMPIHHGWPKDSDWLNEEIAGFWGPSTRREEIDNDNNFSHGWVSLSELLAFDYDQFFEDRYDNNHRGPGGRDERLLPEGKGEIKTVRVFLGDFFFSRIEILKTLGEPENVRVFFNLS